MATKNDNSAPRATVIAAWIGVIAAAVSGFLIALPNWFKNKSEPPGIVAKNARITGRIVNARSQKPVNGAKVSLEVTGVAPVLRYPDAEGVFDFGLPADATNVRVRVEANGYRLYDRLLNVSSMSGIEEIRLEPASGNADGTSSRRPSEYVPAAMTTSTPIPPKQSSIIDETLRPIAGGDGPWSVIVFGGRADRRDDVQGWIRSALASSGHDSVNLFRRVSDEQRVASDLFRGNSSLYNEMQAGRFTSRILVANFTVVTHPGMEGLLIGEAKLSVKLYSPTGELLKSFSLSEKGGGYESDAAQRDAIDGLEKVIAAELPSAI